MEVVGILKWSCRMLLAFILMYSLPLSAQFRVGFMRDDFRQLDILSTSNNKEAYERQFQKVKQAALERGDVNCLCDVYGHKAVYYLRLSDVKTNAAVLAELQKLAESKHSDYGMLQYCLARATSLTGQMLADEALKVLDRAIAICEKHPDDELFNSSYVYSQKGQAYLSYPKYDEAIVEIEKAVEKAGDNKLFQRNPRISLFRLYVANDEHLKEAREHLEWLLQNFPMDEMNHGERETFQFSSVLYYLYLKDTESAQKVVNEMDYNIIRFDCQRRIYECNKDYAKAVEVFEQYIEDSDSVMAELVSKQMNQYDAELAARELDVSNARLLQSNHMLELEQSQRARRILDLKQESHNQRLQTLNMQLELERQQQQLENLQVDKDKRDERIQQERRLARNKMLDRMIVYLSVLLLLFIIFGLMMLWGIRIFRKQKKIAVAAAKHAEEANLMKSRFLQNMNHDLRAPLAAIVSIVDLLNTSDLEITAQEKGQLIEGLRMQSDLLLQLVDDIIDLSALQSGEYHLEYSEVNLHKLCTNAIMGFKARCAEGVEMRVDLPESETILHTDGKRLLEVIGNLLGNATKYTDKGSIVLAYQTRGDEVEFSVTDTGTGIPESQATNIFDRFEKIGSVKKGFGLGLSICQSVVTLMKGRIWLDTAYKRGARFCFTIPRMLLLLLLLSGQEAKAQNNPYRIDDIASEYLNKYLQHQAEPDACMYVDSLMARARAVHDVKGQCIGMNLYTDNLFVTRADIRLLRQSKDRCVAFCRNTPYTQYAFSSWSYLVQRLLDEGLYMQVLKELKVYESLAVELNSVYGKSNGMMYLGRAYERLRQYNHADEAYRNAIRVMQESGDTVNIAAFYLGYADCLRQMKRYTQSLAAYEAGCRACRLPQILLTLLIGEATCQYDMKDAEAMKHTLQRIELLAKENVLSTVSQITYKNLRGKYYALCGDVQLAQQVADSLGEVNVDNNLKRDILQLKGDMQGVFQHMVAVCQRHSEENQRILGLQFREFNLSLENTEKELEQERLRLSNTEMMLQNARQAQQLLALENESDSLRILDAHVSLQAQEAERQLLHQQEADRKAALQQEEAKARHNFRMNAILVGMLVPGLLIVLFGLRRLWKMQKDIVKERKAAIKAQSEAERADEDMSIFMHSMNHEIRTPLNAIIGFSEILNQADDFGLQGEERAQLVARLHLHTQNLQLMVNAILDISKMESGTYIFNREPTLLYVLAEQALEQVRMKAAPGVEILNKVEQTERLYMLDNNRMLVLLSQLLSNACNHTAEGSISLGMNWTEGTLRVDVVDTGEGIPEELQGRIFERFIKADAFADGFGLGLPLCKVIADKMGGRIWLEKSDAHGTHFVVELPCEEDSGTD